MKLVTAIAKFLYDLLVGDSWPLALVVAAVLIAGIVVTAADLLPPGLIAVGVALAVAAAAPLVVLGEARASRRGSPGE